MVRWIPTLDHTTTKPILPVTSYQRVPAILVTNYMVNWTIVTHPELAQPRLKPDMEHTNATDR